MCDLHSPFFNDPDEARKYLEAQRWPDGAVCPHCGGYERVYTIQPDEKKKIRAGLYQCNDCNKQFTVTVGTVFERSKVGLHKWLAACYLMCSSKKGFSAKQLERSLGITYKTAWFMAHRIREAMRDGSPGIMGGNGGTVEIDETYIGNDGKKKRKARIPIPGKGNCVITLPIDLDKGDWEMVKVMLDAYVSRITANNDSEI